MVSPYHVFNRPGVAAAVQQTPPLLDSFSKESHNLTKVAYMWTVFSIKCPHPIPSTLVKYPLLVLKRGEQDYPKSVGIKLDSTLLWTKSFYHHFLNDGCLNSVRMFEPFRIRNPQFFKNISLSYFFMKNF